MDFAHAELCLLLAGGLSALGPAKEGHPPLAEHFGALLGVDVVVVVDPGAVLLTLQRASVETTGGKFGVFPLHSWWVPTAGHMVMVENMYIAWQTVQGDQGVSNLLTDRLIVSGAEAANGFQS